MNYTTKNTKAENVEVAKAILSSLGISNVELTGYCESNGVSVYFTHPHLKDDCRIRVSDHGISNPARMATEVCFKFDTVQFGGYIKSQTSINKMIAEKFNF